MIILIYLKPLTVSIEKPAQTATNLWQLSLALGVGIESARLNVPSIMNRIGVSKAAPAANQGLFSELLIYPETILFPWLASQKPVATTGLC